MATAKDPKDKDDAGAAVEADKSEKVAFVTVKSTHPDDERVAFSEQHKDHPDGEAFVYGDKSVKVARTSEVIRALNEGRIVEA